MQHSDDTRDLKGRVDFGIITVREDEFEAILKRFPTERLAHGRLTYAVSKLTTINDDEYQIASVRCPEQGNTHGQSVAHSLIEELDPQWLLLIGIAGSIPNEEYTLGDVLLSARLHNFSVTASIEDSQQQTHREYSETGGPMHPKVQDLIAHLPALSPFLDRWYEPDSIGVSRPQVSFAASKFYGDADWKKNVRSCLSRYFGKHAVRANPKAFTGSIASSDTLVKSTQLASEWLKVARQIRGVEMELAGVYQAAWSAQKPVLAIRGISDVVGYKRSADWTNYACNTAASFAHALLKSRPIAPVSVQTEHASLPIVGVVATPTEPVGVFRNKPVNVGPVQKDERLFSNLLEVSYFPAKLYTVRTPCADRKEIWSLLREETEHPPSDWIYKGKTLYAFHGFSDSIWQKVCESSTLEEHDTSDWSDSADPNRRAEFIELLKGCLKELGRTHDLYYSHRPRVRKRRKKLEHLYFAPTSEYSGSPYFDITDLINPYDFIISLKDGTSAAAKHLSAELSDSSRQLIASFSHQDRISRDLLAALVENLNEVLKLSDFYQEEYFADVYVRRDAKELLEADALEESEMIHLNRMLLEDAFPNEIFKRSLCQRTLVRQSVVQSRPRVVFKAYYSRARKFSHYRHHAFRFQFIRIEGKWYLEITPTYHYTHDGYRVCWFYEDLVKGIKRVETNEAVFRHVLFWSEVLQEKPDGFFQGPSYPFLRFRRLAEFKSEFGVPDRQWATKESQRLKRAAESQSSLVYES